MFQNNKSIPRVWKRYFYFFPTCPTTTKTTKTGFLGGQTIESWYTLLYNYLPTNCFSRRWWFHRARRFDLSFVVMCRCVCTRKNASVHYLALHFSSLLFESVRKLCGMSSSHARQTWQLWSCVRPCCQCTLHVDELRRCCPLIRLKKWDRKLLWEVKDVAAGGEINRSLLAYSLFSSSSFSR